MENSHTQHQPQAYVVVAVVGVVPVADRAAQVVCVVVPGPAVSCSTPPANVNDGEIFGKPGKRHSAVVAEQFLPHFPMAPLAPLLQLRKAGSAMAQAPGEPGGRPAKPIRYGCKYIRGIAGGQQRFP